MSVRGGQRWVLLSSWLAVNIASTACGGKTKEAFGRLQTEGLNPTRLDSGYVAGFDAGDFTLGADAGPPCSADYSEVPDDCDPNNPLSWEIDCDGDGAPGAQFISCDPKLRVTAQTAAPPSSFDCDDRAPQVHPLADEGWGDGLDTNCDGQVAPSCEALESGSVGAPLGIPAGDCDGAQLEFGETVACPHACTDETALLFGYVVNRGGRASTERVSLKWLDDRGEAGEVVINAGIEPGGVSSPFRLEYHYTVNFTVWFEHDAGECVAENTRIELDSERVPCIR